MSPYTILRTCHACSQPHYAVDWYELPLVEIKINRGWDGAVEVRACIKCGTRLHVFTDDAHQSLAGIRPLITHLKSNESSLQWATAWSQNGEEPLARAWRHEPNPAALLEFLDWWEPVAAWTALATIVAAAGVSDPIAFTRPEPEYGFEDARDATTWWNNHGAFHTNAVGDEYLAGLIRNAYAPPTLSECIRSMRERVATAA